MEQLTIIKRKTFDPFQRILHWSIALCCMLLLITGLSSDLFEAGPVRSQIWHFHIRIGYVLIVTLSLRIIWALIGPRFAHIRDLLKYFDRRQRARPQFTQFGHDPKAGLAYLGLYTALIVLNLTGLVLAGIKHNWGPFASLTFDRLYLLDFFKKPHEALAYLIILFTITHLGALLWHQNKHKLPMWYAMFDGIQYRLKQRKVNNVQENHYSDNNHKRIS